VEPGRFEKPAAVLLCGDWAAIAGIPLKRGGVPNDMAGAVPFLVSDLAAFITGEITEINGGAWFKQGS
jgi:NAD(P)-dependent dehydrogenase (short-subunit alcohol dehydrogenase family)